MQDQTGTFATPADSDISRRVLRLQILTVAWMSIEVIVALAAAWSAKSSAPLGFGGDSAVELLSAIVVSWRFRSASDSTGGWQARLVPLAFQRSSVARLHQASLEAHLTA